MSTSEGGEFAFIRGIQPGCLIRPEGVVLGIGDDAAAVETSGEPLTLMTTDLMVEGVHFLRDRMTGAELGHKVLAVNLSDIAAMGGTPLDAYVSLAVPEDCDSVYLDGVYAGMKALAARYAVNILGGDTTRSRTDLVINITLRGVAVADQLLRRDGARVGDVLCCTGNLGDSRAGLENLLAGGCTKEEPFCSLHRVHVLPEPHVEEGRFLSGLGCRAGMDISDGLSSDAKHLARASGVGLRLYAERMPISEALHSYCAQRGGEAWEYALNGGEDYVLLCALSPDRFESVSEAFRERFGRPLAQIGELTERLECEWVDASGTVHVLQPGGWDHFQKGHHG